MSVYQFHILAINELTCVLQIRTNIFTTMSTIVPAYEDTNIINNLLINYYMLEDMRFRNRYNTNTGNT